MEIPERTTRSKSGIVLLSGVKLARAPRKKRTNEIDEDMNIIEAEFDDDRNGIETEFDDDMTRIETEVVEPPIQENSEPVKKNKKEARISLYQSKCSQPCLHNLLAKLDEQKKEILKKDSLFGPFLRIPKRNICHGVIEYIVRNYDLENDTFVIGEEKISFCLDEVNKCLGLPIEGKRKLDTKIHQDYPEFVHKYLETVVQAGRKKKKDGSESIPARKMLESIIVLFDIENNSKTDFLRLCLLYMFNVFFFPTSDPNISLEHLKYLKDMTAFSEYAWGKIVWEHTLDGVKETRRRVEQGKNGRGYYIKGCLPLLETLLYERLSCLEKANAFL